MDKIKLYGNDFQPFIMNVVTDCSTYDITIGIGTYMNR